MALSQNFHTTKAPSKTATGTRVPTTAGTVTSSEARCCGCGTVPFEGDGETLREGVGAGLEPIDGDAEVDVTGLESIDGDAEGEVDATAEELGKADGVEDCDDVGEGDGVASTNVATAPRLRLMNPEPTIRCCPSLATASDVSVPESVPNSGNGACTSWYPVALRAK